jgi:hypothetical protein
VSIPVTLVRVTAKGAKELPAIPDEHSYVELPAKVRRECGPEGYWQQRCRCCRRGAPCIQASAGTVAAVCEAIYASHHG